MSGNASRKYKQHKLMQERRRYFGDFSARDENGRLDLTAYGASQGRVITSGTKFDQARIPVKAK